MKSEPSQQAGRSPRAHSRKTPSIIKIAEQLEEIAKRRAVTLFEEIVFDRAMRMLEPLGTPKAQEQQGPDKK